MKTIRSVVSLVLVVVGAACGGPEALELEADRTIATAEGELTAVMRFPNANGLAETISVNGPIDTSSNNPFFRSMGQNGRTCGTCTACHDAPNVGNHSVRLPVDLGLSDVSRRTPDMPLYTFCKRLMDPNGAPMPGTCDPAVAQIQTTDPGAALITRKWAQTSTFKGPTLRALSGRGPYFHNGSAETLADVVEFYDSRFAMGLTTEEKADLTAFLEAL